ncbi:MAG: (d)CMP kinase [Candidatus Woesearchaeota archaeon]
MIITISGMPGSGKSTLAKMLAEKINYKRYYMGGIMRELAKKNKLSIIEYQKLGENNPKIDKEIDEYQIKLAKENKDVILEGRTSAFLIPKSIKIFIDVDLKEGAKRVFNDLKKEERSTEEKVQNIEQMKEKMLERMKTENKRYKKYYSIDNIYDKNKFDIIIDTTKLSIQEAFEKLIKQLQQYL